MVRMVSARPRRSNLNQQKQRMEHGGLILAILQGRVLFFTQFA